MSWLTQIIGSRRQRMSFEDEATPESVRAEWMREWMEEDDTPRGSDSHPPVVFKWIGHWTRWSQMSHTYEPVEGRLVPATLVEFGNTLDPPPSEGDRFRLADGVWTRLDPDAPDEPPPPDPTDDVEDNEAEADEAQLPRPLPSSALPPARPIENTTSADPVADQISAWRRRIRRGSGR